MASAAETTVALVDLQSDVNILESEYRALHPELLRYMSPDDLNRAFAQLRQEFSRPRTLAQAYLALSVFSASIKCGHTYGNFFNQTRAVQTGLFEPTPRLPFYFQGSAGWIRNNPDRRQPLGANPATTNDFRPGGWLQ